MAKHDLQLLHFSIPLVLILSISSEVLAPYRILFLVTRQLPLILPTELNTKIYLFIILISLSILIISSFRKRILLFFAVAPAPIASALLLFNSLFEITQVNAVTGALALGAVSWLAAAAAASLTPLTSLGFLAGFSVLLLLTPWVEPLRIQHILQFGLLFAAFRFVILFVQANLDLFKQGIDSELKKALCHSVGYWSPFIVPILIGFWLQFTANSEFRRAAYDSAKLVLTAPEALAHLDAAKRDNPRDDLKIAVGYEFDALRRMATEEIDSIEKAGNVTADQLPAELNARLQRRVPARVVEPPRCKGWSRFSVSCRARQYASNKANEVWSDMRGDMIGWAVEQTRNATNSVRGTANSGFAASRASIEKNQAAAKRETLSSIDLAFDIVDILNILSTMIFIFALIKSFSVIFSRVFYAQQQKKALNRYFTLEEPGVASEEEPGVASDKLPSRSLRLCGNIYRMRISGSQRYYASVWQNRLGGKPKPRIPKWRQAPFARLISGRYFMTELTLPEQDGGSVIFSSDARSNFVAVSLNPNQQVIIGFGSIVAVTQGIRFSTVFSLKVSSLLFGRTFFHCVQGPGRVILKVMGEPAFRNTHGAAKTFDPTCLAAWDRSTQFSVVSELGWWDIYGAGIRFAKREDHSVILQASEPRWWHFGGAARFIGCFILPV